MGEFQHTDYLWGAMIVIPLLVLFLLYRRWRSSARKRFATDEVHGEVFTASGTWRAATKISTFLLGMVFLVLTLANLLYGSEKRVVEKKGIDLMFALDISRSMLAEDLRPNRLEKAKYIISKVVDQLGGDKVGLVVFAGQAFVQIPITTDHTATKMFLSHINTKLAPVQGTNIGSAIDLSVESFDFNNKRNKAVIVLSDGENHEEDALIAAEKAVAKGVKVFTVGMGLSKGAVIPKVPNRPDKGYRTDKEGNVVLSKLNEDMMRNVAKKGEGNYVKADNSQAALNTLMESLNKIEKTTMDTMEVDDSKSLFQYTLLIAIVCFLVYFVIGDSVPRSGWI